MSIYKQLLEVKQKHGAGHLVLIDPDKNDRSRIFELLQQYEAAGVDALLIGGSLVFTTDWDDLIRKIKQTIHIPVIIFPGSKMQLSAHADAILFLSLISGRNPNYLIGDQVLAAPMIKAMGIEPISTGYMLIESGETTSAQFMSGTSPIPRHKPDIAVAHALAAEFLGMKFVYLEAGSGAKYPVPEEMIGAIDQYCHIPIIVGGGLRQPEEALKKVKAGASFIVTGNVLEKSASDALVREFVAAIHYQSATIG